MKNYLRPLWVFVAGEFLLLFAFLFLAPLDTAGAKLAVDTAGIASTFWGWSWAPTIGKWVFIFAMQLGVLWATAKSFLAIRDE